MMTYMGPCSSWRFFFFQKRPLQTWRSRQLFWKPIHFLWSNDSNIVDKRRKSEVNKTVTYIVSTTIPFFFSLQSFFFACNEFRLCYYFTSRPHGRLGGTCFEILKLKFGILQSEVNGPFGLFSESLNCQVASLVTVTLVPLACHLSFSTWMLDQLYPFSASAGPYAHNSHELRAGQHEKIFMLLNSRLIELVCSCRRGKLMLVWLLLGFLV